VGGQAAISTQQLAMIDLAVKTKLLLDSIDAWLLTQPTLIDDGGHAERVPRHLRAQAFL
jgi:hypothetical protein